MVKLLSATLLLLFTTGMAADVHAQASKKTKKAKIARKTTAKKKNIPVTAAVREDEALMKLEDGKYLYTGREGDQLVYEVNAGGNIYDFIVTLKPGKDEESLSFDWVMTAPVNRQGHVDVSAAAKDSSHKYINYFSGGNLNLTDACTVWMTGVNFRDMPGKKTSMQIDDNDPEMFYRKDEAETAYTIRYKEHDITLGIFKIDNDKAANQHRQMWIQGISSYPLIVKMDMGWTIRLKEIK